MKNFVNEFKKFALRGNVLDMAVWPRNGRHRLFGLAQQPCGKDVAGDRR